MEGLATTVWIPAFAGIRGGVIGVLRLCLRARAFLCGATRRVFILASAGYYGSDFFALGGGHSPFQGADVFFHFLRGGGFRPSLRITVGSDATHDKASWATVIPLSAAMVLRFSTFAKLSRNVCPWNMGCPKAVRLRRQSSASNLVSGVIAPVSRPWASEPYAIIPMPLSRQNGMISGSRAEVEQVVADLVGDYGEDFKAVRHLRWAEVADAAVADFALLSGSPRTPPSARTWGAIRRASGIR